MIRPIRYAVLAVLCVVLGVTIYQVLRWYGAWDRLNDSQVKGLDHGDQEIALIEPATNFDDWGRIVTALQLLEKAWPKIHPTLPPLHVGLDDAFPPLTAEVPEIAFSFGNAPGPKLRLRWYKISGEHDAGSWVRKLHERRRPPLAIVGGGTSDRAIKLAYRMKDNFGDDPTQSAPVLLITTATSEKTTSGKSLIDVYRQRTFRFSFTNQKMVESLLTFVEHRDYPKEEKYWAHNLWVHKPGDPHALTNAVASMAGAGDSWHAWGVLRGFPHLQPYAMHSVQWEDERYSKDMASLFAQEFTRRAPYSEHFQESPIPFSVGGFFHPSPQEQHVVDTFLARPTPITPHTLLVLPTQTLRMRRFLINLRQRSPLDARNLVILNGDAISFHSVYRDRKVMWNILDLPYSLVFFAHRNPIDPAAGFTWTRDDRKKADDAFPPLTTSGTHDTLLYRDLFEAFLYAACDQGQPLSDSLLVRERLQATCWYQPPPDRWKQEAARVRNPRVGAWEGERRAFFDASGNRQSRTGEHIVWVKPSFYEDRVNNASKISVWSLQADRNGGIWQFVDASPLEDVLP